MTGNIKNYLYTLFPKLSIEERREIIAYLKDMNLNSDKALKISLIKLERSAIAADFSAPIVKAKKW